MQNQKYMRDMNNIRTKIRTFKKQGLDVLFSAIFITGKNKEKLLDHAPIEHLSLITKNLNCEKPDRIRIELYDGKEGTNNIWFKDIFLNPLTEQEEAIPENKGLGEAEINHIVDERFRERQRSTEYEVMKVQVGELMQENQKLQDEIDKLEIVNSDLEKELENKKQVRYYAGMLGDILESFGIAKDKLKRPLVELMGIEDGERNDKQIAPSKEDQSGIVDESKISPEEKKRNEIISLISDYLRVTSNQTLANIFTIFSDIEQDNSVAELILEFLKSKKQTA